MTLEGFRSVPQFKSMQAESPAMEEFAREYNKIVSYLRSLRSLMEKHDRAIKPELVRLADNMGLPCTDETDFTDADGTIQYFDADGNLTDAGINRFRVVPVFDVPYDAAEIVATVYHHQSGRFIPVNMRTVRHMRLVLDIDGDYPVPSDTATGPCVYPFKFMRLEYTEVIGGQQPTKQYMCPENKNPDGYVMNMLCGEWLEPGTIIWGYHVTGQWYSYTPSTCDLDSTQSVSSKSSSESSGHSSQSSSNSSSASSVSASSASSNISSASSGGSSLSSGGSSASSGGSSASSNLSSASSGGSSASSVSISHSAGACIGGTCSFTWNGSSWDLVFNSCSPCACNPPPTAGLFVGESRPGSCV